MHMARTKGAVADKFWNEAVRLAVYREERDDEGKKRKRISIIADKLCRLAMAGDMAAIREIGDRLDGKAPQGVDVTTGGDKLAFPTEIILRAASDAGDN